MGWGPALLQCLANVCGGKSAAARNSPNGQTEEEPSRAVKPVIRLDEIDGKLETAEGLMSSLNMLPAPPGAAANPKAVVSADFQGNSSRLMVLVPPKDAPFGAWAPHLCACGLSSSLIQWGAANGFATALFNGEIFANAPAKVWEDVLKGCPAKFAVIVVSEDMFQVVQDALSNIHALLVSRYRVVCTAPGRNGYIGATISSSLPADLRKQLSNAFMQLSPETWNSSASPAVAHDRLIDTVIKRQEKLENTEMKKYSGFQNLKENDMPGLKRLGVEERVAKLDRDRNKDELARLCHNNHEDADEEPGQD